MIRTCQKCGEVIPDGRASCVVCDLAPPNDADTVGEETAATTGSSRSEPAAPPKVVAGRYRLIERLGAGGSGEVHRAYDRELDCEVALKLLSKDASDKSISRFRREVGLAQAFSHPGLVRVHDIGRTDDRYYLSMQLVHGRSVSARVHEKGPFPTDEARKLFTEVCEAVRYLHSLGIVHRDIKPGNVLLDEAGHAVLVDFGLARHEVDEQSEATEVAGTPGYMAPEAMLGEPPSVSTDIYGLGATFYAVLTGKRVAEGSTWSDVLLRGREGIPAVRALRPDVPPQLAFVVEECLRPDPRERFGSVDEVLEALAIAGAPRWKQIFIRLQRRRRLPLLALAAVGVLGLAGAASWAVHDAGRAVEVEVGGRTLRGTNRFGGIAWERSYGGPSVSVTAWPDVCDGSTLYHATEASDAPGSTWTFRNHLLTARGEELFDSTSLEAGSLGFFNPRDEFSGAVSFDVLPWSRCQAPEGSTALPLLASNNPWYFSVLGFHQPHEGSGVSFAFSGRVVSVAASRVPDEPVVYGIVAGNHELLHTSAFAIVPADSFSGAGPPRMVDQTFDDNGLRSYTLLPTDHKTYDVNAVVAELDGSWRVCTPENRCEAIDRFGNRAAALRENAGTDAEALWRDRMERFRRLSEVDLSRRRGAYEAADDEYRALAARPFGDTVEQAALHLVGARIAAALGDLRAVVARSARSEALWDITEDAALVRAEARIVAGEHEAALRDLHGAQGRRAATIYNVTKWRFFSAWLSGEHALAEQLLDEIDFPVLQARLRAFVLIENGEPDRALGLLDPWAGHFVRDRVQMLRALALVDLRRTEEARRALTAEVDRHPWLRGETDSVSLAADLADETAVDPERASAILDEAERRGRRDMEARLLVTRVRVEVADAFLRAGDGDRARALLDRVSAEHPGTALLARARRMRESLDDGGE